MISSFRRFGNNFQFIRQGFATDNQGMVSSGLKRDRQPEEYTIPFVKDRRSLPVHQAIGSNDFSSIHLADTLMSKANTQHGNSRSEMTDKLVADAGFVRRSRTRRNADFFWMQLLNFLNGGAIIPADDQFRAEFAEILNQIVGERVVVIQNQNHTICSARSIARKVAMALLTLS